LFFYCQIFHNLSEIKNFQFVAAIQRVLFLTAYYAFLNHINAGFETRRLIDNTAFISINNKLGKKPSMRLLPLVFLTRFSKETARR